MQPIRAIYHGSAHRNMTCLLLNTITCRMDDDGFTESFAHIVLMEEENGKAYGVLKQVPMKQITYLLTPDEKRYLNTRLPE